MTRRAIPELRRSGGGVICNVTTASLLFPLPFFAAYRASKAAVSAVGESLRAELAPHRIRLVDGASGFITTAAGSAGNPIKLSAHEDPATREAAPALDGDRQRILAELDELDARATRP